MIPIGDELPVSQLPKGNYRLEVRATDSAGRSTPWRTASFTLK
jgi:predicted phage tail protein